LDFTSSILQIIVLNPVTDEFLHIMHIPGLRKINDKEGIDPYRIIIWRD